MRAVINDEEYEQKYPVYSDEPKNRKQINARQLWNKIVHNAWKSAEPGILFWDTIIRESVPDCYADKGYRTVSTNPCGEIPLCPYDSCRLLAINLYSYVQNPFTKGAFFDFPLFKKHVAIAQRIMDDIIDLELEKIDAILDKVHEDPESEEVKGVEIRLWEKIKQKAKEGRRTGVGITAEGDMLAALGLRYGSEEAIDFAVDIQKTLAVEAYRASVHLAKDRGSLRFTIPAVRRIILHQALTRSRSRYVCRNGEVRTPEYCLSDDRTNRNDKPDDSDDFRYRTCVPACIQTEKKGKPERSERTYRFCG